MKTKTNLSYFITQLTINESRLIKNFKISLSPKRRKHLIITGKNGSGKTTLLKDIDRVISSLNRTKYSFLGRREGILQEYLLEEKRLKRNIEKTQEFITMKQNELKLSQNTVERKILKMDLDQYERRSVELGEKLSRTRLRIAELRSTIKELSTIDIDFSEYNLIDQIESGNFIYIFFGARRSGGINRGEGLRRDMGKATKYHQFESYLVNLKIEYFFAKEKKELKRARELQKWFNEFEKFLKKIFQKEELKLDFKYKDQKTQCVIIYDNQEFDFNQLSDGYSALVEVHHLWHFFPIDSCHCITHSIGVL